MPLNPSRPPSPQEDEGLKHELTGLARDAGRYLQARGELLAIESQEAAEHLKKRGIMFALAAFFGLFTYLLINAGIVVCLGAYLTILEKGNLLSWGGSTLLVGAINGLFALFFLRRFRNIPNEKFFEYTRNEWTKDQACINSNSNARKS